MKSFAARYMCRGRRSRCNLSIISRQQRKTVIPSFPDLVLSLQRQKCNFFTDSNIQDHRGRWQNSAMTVLVRTPVDLRCPSCGKIGLAIVSSAVPEELRLAK